MQKVLVICGPTCTGKTSISLKLAETFNGEIINADSMQIYKEMNIGTAKITKEEMRNIPHHLFDIKSIKESFSVAEFQKLVREKILEISSRNKLPIIVGGTGLYLKAALYDYEFIEEVSTNNNYEELSLEELVNKLKNADIETYNKIDLKNKKRVIRALQIYDNQGISKEKHNSLQEHKPIYDVKFLGLTRDRKELYELIDNRVDQMIDNGLLEEAKYIYENAKKGSTCLQAIGYKELFEYFNNKCELKDAIYRIKINTHQFAKRQYTWFNHQMNVIWFDVSSLNFENNITEFVKGWLNG